MKTSDFFFDLPQELIAQFPATKRGDSRLLVYDKSCKNSSEDDFSGIEDCKFIDIIDKIPENSLMVFNDTRVRKARLYGKSESGGKVEVLFLSNNGDASWRVITSKSKKQKVGKVIIFDNEVKIEVIEDLGREKIVKFLTPVGEDFFESCGNIPLPPYIKRDLVDSDQERYQTVFANSVGSAAAPTAGLHFTDDILEKLKSRGIEIVFVTLHVGLGTFLPVSSEIVEEHKMHREYYEISEESAKIINQAKKTGREIVAVGTTSTRTLEAQWQKNGKIVAGVDSTDIFIYPGFKFKVVDHLFTNFHTPGSSLILLVSAFVGIDDIKMCYKHAIEEKYRFFSYGDSCLFLNCNN